MHARIAVIAMIALAATPTLAAPPGKIDPRIVDRVVAAQAAEIELRNAVIDAMRDDMARREREWADYARPLWEPAPK